MGNAMSMETLKSKISLTREGFILLVTVTGVAVSCFNFLILNQLAPITARIQSVEARTEKLENTSGTVASKSDLEVLNKNVNQRFDDIKDNLTSISDRLDSFILR